MALQGSEAQCMSHHGQQAEAQREVLGLQQAEVQMPLRPPDSGMLQMQPEGLTTQ